MSEMKIDRASRSADTRAKAERRKPWSPPSRLDTPPAPEGFEYRWIRAEVNGFEDKKNVYSKLREGFELVRLDELPEEYQHLLPTVEDGKHAGVVVDVAGVEGVRAHGLEHVLLVRAGGRDVAPHELVRRLQGGEVGALLGGGHGAPRSPAIGAPAVRLPERCTPYGAFPVGGVHEHPLSSVTAPTTVRVPERFRGGCSFGAPPLAASVALPAGCVTATAW